MNPDKIRKLNKIHALLTIQKSQLQNALTSAANSSKIAPIEVPKGKSA
ncbi:MAG: hypothetical protein RI983_1607 [Bacteroidota bacterium]|jgi:hypothetical protein